ncbi:hypothetical protein KKB71_01485, partial [Patescibacteria group bacterium]|nr:hypothetical protein [Patescibacteria group bacterium]MBU2219335.1 hypothetical protein [Patescibacteria group bacterium]
MNKGIAPIAIILIIIGVLVLAGGVYYAKNKIIPKPPKEFDQTYFEFNPTLLNNQELILPNLISAKTSEKAVKVELYKSEIMQGMNSVDVFIASDESP